MQRRRLRVVLVWAGVWFGISLSTLAAERHMNQAPDPSQSTPTVAQRPPSRPEFGTTYDSVEQVISYGFSVVNPFSDSVKEDGDAYRWISGAGPNEFYMVAPVHLPSGVIIDYIGLDYCDTDPAATYTLTMFNSYGDHTFDNIGSITPPANQSACGYVYNSTAFNYSYNQNWGNLLSLYLFQPSSIVDGSLKFRGVEVWYRRQVSPAPGAPTFNDVPASDSGFQYIEALVASGITAGCGGGNYCPDNPLTRRQMAVFLAKGFGLHFPY